MRLLLVCGLIVLSAVIAFSILPQKTLDSHECFVSISAREMLQSGDWVFPTCNGGLRINKTPLPYWIAASIGKMTGSIDEFSARLPSAIFAILSSVGILFFVNRFSSFRTAVISVLVWITSLVYYRASHNARPDMTLTFFVMICFLSFYAAVITENRREQVIYMLAFWFSLGFGMLAKGPAPLTYVLIPLFVYIAVKRKWKLIPKLLPVIGTIIFLLIVLPWPLAIAHKVNWNLNIWKLEFVDRLYGEYAPGKYPFYYYFYILFKFIMPWVIFIPLALAAPFYIVWNKRQNFMKFLWFWFVVGIIFLTIDAGKRQHYLYPVLPAISILIGFVIEEMIFGDKIFSAQFVRNVFIVQLVVIAGYILSSTIFVAKKIPGNLAIIIIFGILAVSAIAAMPFLIKRQKTVHACVFAFSALAAWVTVFNNAFWIATDIDKPAREFAKSVSELVPPANNLIAYKAASTRFVQYFGKTVPEVNDMTELKNRYEQGDWIVCNLYYLKEFSKNTQFRPVYSKTEIEGKEKDDAGGVLYHKTAPTIVEPKTGVIDSKSISVKGG